MSHYIMLYKYVSERVIYLRCSYFDFSVVFKIWGHCYTVIPFVLVGYKMITANMCSWNNC